MMHDKLPLLFCEKGTIFYGLLSTFISYKAKAKEYYENIIRIGSEENKEAARDGLKSL